MRTVAVLLVSFAFASVSATQAHAASARSTEVTSPPRLRLPGHVRPTSYEVKLRIVPEETSFKGTVRIDVALERPSRLIWLNADTLKVERATAHVGGKALAARVVAGGKSFIGLAFDEGLPKGAATLELAYEGVLSRTDSAGAFAQREGEDWYVFTQMQPIDARRVFPCFDEPSFKTPWTLELVVPKADGAFFNTPQLSRVPAEMGYERVSFARTKPLPTSLIAFAVGPFDVVDAGKSRVSGTPVRVLTPRGMAGQARYAREISAELLSRMEELLGFPYPYEKVDLLSIPLFSTVAMENPGLTTFASHRILRQPAEESLSWRQSYAGLAAHELAHQWFGNLVTTAWWDDLWLNEAFATWLPPKVLGPWYPSWPESEDRERSRAYAMTADGLTTARKIRQPIVVEDDMKDAFDSITYSKGAAVLRMFESWLGPELFLGGIRRYLRQHAHGTATSKDLLTSLSTEAKRPLAPYFSSFLDQPGVPLLTFDVRCEGKPHVRVRQTRYLPLGSSGGRGNSAGKWQLPVCIRAGKGGLTENVCGLMTSATAKLPLKACPDALLPNADAAGYFRAQVEGPELTNLLKADMGALTPTEKLAVLGDLRALVSAGKLPVAELLSLVPHFAKDAHPYVVESAVAAVAQVRSSELLPERLLPAYAAFVRTHFGERARALGWMPRPGEEENALLLRKALVPFVAGDGEEPALRTEAGKLAREWMAKRRGVHPELLDSVLAVAARSGDAALHRDWVQAVQKEGDRLARARILKALSGFHQPALAEKGLTLTLADAVDVRESMALLWGATEHPETRQTAWRFLTSSYDKLVERLPRDGGARLPWVGAALCDAQRLPEVEAFFRTRAPLVLGGPRALAQALESMRLCIASRQAQAPSAAAFFEGIARH